MVRTSRMAPCLSCKLMDLCNHRDSRHADCLRSRCVHDKRESTARATVVTIICNSDSSLSAANRQEISEEVSSEPHPEPDHSQTFGCTVALTENHMKSVLSQVQSRSEHRKRCITYTTFYSLLSRKISAPNIRRCSSRGIPPSIVIRWRTFRLSKN